MREKTSWCAEGHPDALNAAMERNIEVLNEQVPAYCKVCGFELRFEPFAKTPKGSIKHFMYSLPLWQSRQAVLKGCAVVELMRALYLFLRLRIIFATFMRWSAILSTLLDISRYCAPTEALQSPSPIRLMWLSSIILV